MVVDDTEPLLAPLPGSWPLEELADARVLLIGVGSIGSAAARALASAGIRHLTLVDPDRLLNHNLARHRVHPRHVGRFKVDAMREQLRDRECSFALRTGSLGAAAQCPNHADAKATLEPSTASMMYWTSCCSTSCSAAKLRAARGGRLS